MEKIKALENQIQSAKNIREKIDVMNALSWELTTIDPERGIPICQEAYHLSMSGEFDKNPYLAGMAESLLILAHFNLNVGNFEQSLSQSFQSLSLFQQLDDLRKQAMVYRNIGAVYISVNQYPDGLDILFKALDIAEFLDDQHLIAEIALNLGALYQEIGDLEKSQFELQKSCQIFRDLNDLRLMAYPLFNLGSLFSIQKNYQQALSIFMECVRDYKSSNNSLIYCNAQIEIGMIYFELQDFEQAMDWFKIGLQEAQVKGFKQAEEFAILGIGKVLRKEGRLLDAVDQFNQALEIALRLKVSVDQQLCYQMLAETYEDLGNYLQALNALKKCREVESKVTEQKLDQKLKTLEISYQTQVSRKESEIIQKVNQKLEQEIVDRERIEKALRKSEEEFRILAALDPLTQLKNRRKFFELAADEVSRARRFIRPLCAIMVDIDHFKWVNDTYGHQKGDEILKICANLIKSCLRDVDIIGRYGGEEFAILLPETTLECGKIVADRLVNTFFENPLVLQKDSVYITVSIGLAEWVDNLDVDTLINRADLAMYAAKRAGRNQHSVWGDSS